MLISTLQRFPINKCQNASEKIMPEPYTAHQTRNLAQTSVWPSQNHWIGYRIQYTSKYNYHMEEICWPNFKMLVTYHIKEIEIRYPLTEMLNLPSCIGCKKCKRFATPLLLKKFSSQRQTGNFECTYRCTCNFEHLKWSNTLISTRKSSTYALTLVSFFIAAFLEI